VDLYTRRQLTLLLVVVLVAGAGLGIDRWRRTHPDEAARLEALDRAPVATPPTTPRPEARPVSDTTPPRARTPLDLNLASQHDLERLPGIGAGLATRIVDTRAQRGVFASVDDLRRVRGIGNATLARLRPFVFIGPAP
jgi:competence ComEA-like helix-hairpin-helix protein